MVPKFDLMPTYCKFQWKRKLHHCTGNKYVKSRFCLSAGINLTLRDKFKSCDIYFYIFNQKKRLKNYEKCFFLFYQEISVISQDIQIFVLTSFLLFASRPLLNLTKKLIEDKSYSVWSHHSNLQITVKNTTFSISLEEKKVWFWNLGQL